MRKSISAFLDQRLAEEDRKSVSQHLERCRDCAERFHDLADVQRLLQELPKAQTPKRLESQLRVIASHERSRNLARANFAAVWQHWRDRAQLVIDNMMRPMALPFAGGLISALLLFSMLVPNLNVPADNRDDVPTVFYTAPTLLQTAPFSFGDDDLVVELTIDRNGQITDYSVPRGKVTPEIVADIGNLMLFSSFTPATLFGQPTSGKILISFRRSRPVVVRG